MSCKINMFSDPDTFKKSLNFGVIPDRTMLLTAEESGAPVEVIEMIAKAIFTPEQQGVMDAVYPSAQETFKNHRLKKEILGKIITVIPSVITKDFFDEFPELFSDDESYKWMEVNGCVVDFFREQTTYELIKKQINNY